MSPCSSCDSPRLDKTASATSAVLPGFVNPWYERFIMNTKLFPTVAAVVIALAGAVATSAMAVEATQYVPEAGTLTRAEVTSELNSKAPANVIQYGEASVFVDQPAASRQGPVLAFAAHSVDTSTSTRVVQVGDATVFVDEPGTRTRADVRNESLAGIRGVRSH